VSTTALFNQAIQAKASYHKKAKAISWEEKIASIERMREASHEARRSMAAARSSSKRR
jgi:hypothetical protein